MAGSLVLSPDGVAITTSVLAGTQADIDTGTRKSAKRLNYDTITGGDADADLIDTVREFMVDHFTGLLDGEHRAQAKTENQQAATADVASIVLPGASTTA